MPPRRKNLTDQDRSDWALFTRHIKLLPGRDPLEMPPALPAVSPEPKPRAPAPQHARPAAALPRPVSVGEQPGGLDKATWNRFRTGKLAPTRTIDLHGRTAQRAFHALQDFLLAAHADHVRCVEVITGRGAGEIGGILRRELPVWLNLPGLRPLILVASHPHAANPGAVRLLLRRHR